MAGEITFHDNQREVQLILKQLGDNADAYILAGMVLDYTLWVRWKDVICLELPKPGLKRQEFKFVEDFTLPVDNAIYHAIYLYNMQFTRASDFRPASPQLIALGLDRLAKQGTVLGLSEYPQALNRICGILQDGQAGHAAQLAGRIVEAWVMHRRKTRLGATMAAGGHSLALSDLQATLNQTLAQVGAANSSSRNYEMAMSLEHEPLDIRQAYPLVLPRVSEAMGGGVRKKDATLVIAAQGVGKTIHFLQGTAGLFLGQHLRVLGITTEQEPKELELRNISRECGIPMRKMVDGFDKSRFTPEEMGRYKRYLNLAEAARAAGGRYDVHYWPRGQVGLHSKLRDIMRDAQQRWGGLDAVALDWIGGGMELSPQMAQFYRLHMQLLADEFVSAVRDEDVLGVAYTQARAIPREGYDNPRVASENMQENKSLGNNYTNILGFSGMRDKSKGEDQETSQTYLDEQYCFISKARKGSGGLLKWSRKNFAIQKMEDTKS